MIRSAGFALAVVITCLTWNGVRTCSSPNGYVSHESTWNGIRRRHSMSADRKHKLSPLPW